MRWKIKGLVFCEQQQSLTTEQNSVRIEPMMSELLAYFCRHKDQVVSKEQLIDDVWHGRFVSDNTVSKLITKLRKALQDDARNPQFIVTVPKRGYRFIADIAPLEDEPSPKALQSTSSSNFKLPKLFTLVMTTVFTIAVVWLLVSNSASPPATIASKAITSDNGSEYFPSFASDGVRLAYMNHDGDRFRLYVKNTRTAEQVEVTHGSEYGVGPGDWNDSGTKLAYLVATSQSCQYFVRQFDGLVMSEPRLIHTCRAGSFGAIKFTHDDNVLVFSETVESGKPYSLYSLNLTTGKTQWLPQPDIHLAGNSQFDLHPSQNKLLISSPDEQQWEGFYQLDLDSLQLRLLFKLNAYICCGIWSQDGKHVVLMGEHPPREIVQYELDGSNPSVLFTGSQHLHRPERHSNGKDYIFTVFNSDLNTYEYDIATQQNQSILNDTFDERLAVLSPDTSQVAYIGLTSGNEELWLFNREMQTKKKITQYADGRHYLDLTWSPDQMKVAALTLNAIHIIDLNSGDTQVLPLPEKEYRGMSFKSPNIIAFSWKLANQWQVVEFDMTTKTMTRLAPKWQSVRYDKQPENWLWVDQQGSWYHGIHAEPLDLPKPNMAAFYGRQFNIQKSGDSIAFYNW